MKTSPEDPSEKDSKEKVEKVVNPPQNPTTKRALSFGEKFPVLLKIPINNPKMKHPRILIVKVAKGKGAFHINKNNLFIRNRQHVPTNPPHPAINTSFHIAEQNYKKKADFKAGLYLLLDLS